MSADVGFTAVTPEPVLPGVVGFEVFGLVVGALPLGGDFAPEVEQASPAHSVLICWENGSLLRKRLKPSSCPDCGAGSTPGSLRPSPPEAEAASAPPAPVVPVAVAVVVAGGEALALD
jgi:hypothetical protein